MKVVGLEGLMELDDTIRYEFAINDKLLKQYFTIFSDFTMKLQCMGTKSNVVKCKTSSFKKAHSFDLKKKKLIYNIFGLIPRQIQVRGINDNYLC